MKGRALKALYSLNIPVTVEAYANSICFWVYGVPEGYGEKYEPLSEPEKSFIRAAFIRAAIKEDIDEVDIYDNWIDIPGKYWEKEKDINELQREVLNTLTDLQTAKNKDRRKYVAEVREGLEKIARELEELGE